MSARGNCYDNAAMESFWATLKTECFANQIPLNRAHAQKLLFDYIETFYNPKTAAFEPRLVDVIVRVGDPIDGPRLAMNKLCIKPCLG
jgi:hypothetical protein